MKLDKFTVKAQEALQEAQRLAAEHGQQEMLPEPDVGLWSLRCRPERGPLRLEVGRAVCRGRVREPEMVAG